ncbi:hypothetical protein ACFXA0_11500 [Streptomyces cyaneofuscatus]|uniref:hypothetical protein n=1 Tax=Streptomyces cyaneofuscatus TaxID=66883 RepID=UPI003692E563
MTSSVPWQERLSAGTEVVQDEVIRWYRETPEDMLPVHAFNLHGDEVHVELVSSGLNVTGPSELDLYRKAFSRLSDAALYGEAAEELLQKTRSFWAGARRG